MTESTMADIEDSGLKHVTSKYYVLHAGAGSKSFLVKTKSCDKRGITLHPDEHGFIRFYSCGPAAVDTFCNWATKGRFSKDVTASDLVSLYGLARVKKFHALTSKIVATIKGRKDFQDELLTTTGVQSVYQATKASTGLRKYIVDLFLFKTRNMSSKAVHEELMQQMISGNYDFQADCHEKLRDLSNWRRKAINPNCFYRAKRCQYHEHPALMECNLK